MDGAHGSEDHAFKVGVEVYWGYIGIMEKKMETTIIMGYMGDYRDIYWYIGIYRAIQGLYGDILPKLGAPFLGAPQ